MFSEIPYVRQDPGEPGRRCFRSPYFDLVVWFDEPGTIALPTGKTTNIDDEQQRIGIRR